MSIWFFIRTTDIHANTYSFSSRESIRIEFNVNLPEFTIIVSQCHAWVWISIGILLCLDCASSSKLSRKSRLLIKSTDKWMEKTYNAVASFIMPHFCSIYFIFVNNFVQTNGHVSCIQIQCKQRERERKSKQTYEWDEQIWEKERINRKMESKLRP